MTTATPALASRTFSSERHTTHYRESGPSNGPLMIFLHGWPGIGLLWRTQMEAFAAKGWRCIAPDMRGYGGSSAPVEPSAYSTREIAADMVELHDHLGASPAIWIGHDQGSPVTGALASHYPERCRAAVFVSLPYFPTAFAIPTLLSLVDRDLYPANEYPDGPWDYYRFYLTHFDQATEDFDADVSASLAAIYRQGNPAGVGQVYRSATITSGGGWFGEARHAPAITPDPAMWPVDDFAALTDAFHKHGFRPPNAWYLNDDDNIAYAHEGQNDGRLSLPVLFLNGDLDALCDVTRSPLGGPMRAACERLAITTLSSGHWLPLERKPESVQAIQSWLEEHSFTPRGV